MGHSVIPDVKNKTETQANYYLAPEIIMKAEHDNSVDMWGLGCTIYELLTGHILFDSENYPGNTFRHHLYMVAEKLGMFPPNIIDTCNDKDIFFNKKRTCIKGYKCIKMIRPLCNELRDICKHNNLSTYTEDMFVDFMMSLFKYDRHSRLTAQNALSNELFKNK